MAVALVLGVGAGATLEVLQWWLRLRFLRHVYDRGGPADLRAAGAALKSIMDRRSPSGRDNELLP